MQNYTNFMLSFAMELNIHAFTQTDMYYTNIMQIVPEDWNV